MKKLIPFFCNIVLLSFPIYASAMILSSSAFNDDGFIPNKYVYCQPDGKGLIKPGNDVSPPLNWSESPIKTKSFALIVTDPDIPNVPYFNLPGQKIKSADPRITGYHWVTVNISKTINKIPEAAGSKKFVLGGKSPGQTKYGLMGINVYNDVFQSPLAARIAFGKDKSIKGVYGRYDGPCPPFNDEVVHNYTFTIYALDVEKLKLPESGHFTGPQAMEALKDHIIDKAVLVGKFSNNPQHAK